MRLIVLLQNFQYGAFIKERVTEIEPTVGEQIICSETVEPVLELLKVHPTSIVFYSSFMYVEGNTAAARHVFVPQARKIAAPAMLINLSSRVDEDDKGDGHLDKMSNITAIPRLIASITEESTIDTLRAAFPFLKP